MAKLSKNIEGRFSKDLSETPTILEAQEMTVPEIYEKLQEFLVQNEGGGLEQLNSICGCRGGDLDFWNGFFDVLGGIGALGCTEELELGRRLPYGGFFLDRMSLCGDRGRWGDDMHGAMECLSEEAARVKTASSQGQG